MNTLFIFKNLFIFNRLKYKYLDLAPFFIKYANNIFNIVHNTAKFNQTLLCNWHTIFNNNSIYIIIRTSKNT